MPRSRALRRSARQTAAAAAALAGLVLLTSCAAGSPSRAETPAPAAGSPDATVAAAARHARLDPCPSSTPAAAAGGLPDVTLHCLGQAGAATVHLAGLAGRPAVVNVWGSWCPPCREEAPLLQRLHAAAGSRLTVLGVDYEDDDVPALAFTADKALHYPSVADPDGHFPLRRWAAGPPVTFFLDAKGRIVHVQRGPFTSWEQLRTLVDDHLGMSL